MLNRLDVKHTEKSLFLRGSGSRFCYLQALVVVRYPHFCQLFYPIPFTEIIM
jgi:hypothetical protein